MSAYIRCSTLLLTVLLLTAGGSPFFETGHAGAKPGLSASKEEREDMTWVKLKQSFPGRFVTNGSRKTKKVSLTFDDAPDPRFTPQILDLLKERQIRATFFIVGYRAEEHQELVRRIHREGHEIGNHSYNHPNLAELTASRFRSQITDTDRIIRGIAGYSPRFVRPPYGELRPSQVDWTSRQGYTVVNWDVDSVDWKNSEAAVVLHNIRSTLRPGSIILQHAGGGVGQDLSGSIAALPSIIEELQEQGYSIVPLSELIGQPKSRQTKSRPLP